MRTVGWNTLSSPIGWERAGGEGLVHLLLARMNYAIRVPDRQTCLARLATNRSMIYAVKLGPEQRLPANTRQWGRMRVQYVAITE